jgi:hypothetical protein
MKAPIWILGFAGEMLFYFIVLNMVHAGLWIMFYLSLVSWSMVAALI